VKRRRAKAERYRERAASRARDALRGKQGVASWAGKAIASKKGEPRERLAHKWRNLSLKGAASLLSDPGAIGLGADPPLRGRVAMNRARGANLCGKRQSRLFDCTLSALPVSIREKCSLRS